MFSVCLFLPSWAYMMIYMLHFKGSVRRVIRVCGYFGHCYLSQNLYNKMCEVCYVARVTSLHLFPKPFMQTITVYIYIHMYYI
jgi:hypothetical protein